MADDWETMADTGVTAQDIDPKFKEEESVIVTLDKPEEKKIEPQPKNAEKEAKKKKAEELSKKWDEKNLPADEKRGPLTAEELKKAEELSKRSDQKNASDLFGDYMKQTQEQELKTSEAYSAFAKHVAELLSKEDRKKFIQNFVVEVLDAVYPKLTSAEYTEICDKARTLFNKKQAEEKAAEKTGKGKAKAKQPTVNAAKGAEKMTSKMMGFDDDDDDEGYGSKYKDDDFM